MKKIIFFLALIFMASVGYLNAQNFVSQSIEVAERESLQAFDRATWLTWANDPLASVVGAGSNPFGIYHRYTAADLASYVGQSITKMRYMPYNHPDLPTAFTANPRIRIYVGGSVSGTVYNPGTLVVDYLVPTYTFNVLQTIDLPTPVLITGTEEVWFGVYYTLTQGYPGCSTNGNAPGMPNSYIEGKSNIFNSGTTWAPSTNLFNPAAYHSWTHAAFVEDLTAEATILTQVNPAGAGTVTGGGTFNVGTPVTLTATANTGYLFSNWTPGGSAANPLNFNASVDITYTANFQATGGDCAPVTNLTAAYTPDCKAQLTWNAPGKGRGTILWDNNPNANTGGLISSYWSGNDNWVMVADDFDATGPWIIEKIHTSGFSNAPAVLPTNMCVVIYSNTANNKPGAELYRNNAIPVANGAAPEIILPTPFTLPGAGKYWIGIAGAYDVSVPPAALGSFRWNVYYGDQPMGINYQLHDPSNQFGEGTDWLDASGLVPGSYSMDFKLEGDANGATIYAYNIYRDGTLVKTNHPTTAYLDAGFDVFEGHTWEVRTICGASISAPASVTLSNCKDPVCPGTEEFYQVGEGTVAMAQAPIGSYNYFSYAQQIYDAAEIGYGASGNITSISFQYIFGTAGTFPNVDVYLGNTTKTTFASTTDWVLPADMTLVYNGNVTVSAGWVNIEFDIPFVYEGDNVVVAVNFKNGSNAYIGGSATTALWNGTATGTGVNKTIHARKDATPAYNPASPGSGTRLTNRPNIKFGFCVGGDEPGDCDPATNLVVNYNNACNSATLTWTAPAGKGATAPKERPAYVRPAQKQQNPNFIKERFTNRAAQSSKIVEPINRNTIFFEDFESTEAFELPDGWTEVNNTWGWPWFVYDDEWDAVSGYQFLLCPWDYEDDRDTWAFTTGFTLTQGVEYTISFWVIMGYLDGDGDCLKVRMAQSPTVSAMNSGTNIFTNTNGYIEDWTQITYNFTPTTTGTYYIGLHACTEAYDGDAILIDDLSVTAAGTPPPTVAYNIYRNGALVADNVTATTYTATFDNTAPITWSVKVACEEGGESAPVTAEKDICEPAGPDECEALPIVGFEVEYDRVDNDCSAILTWGLGGKKSTEPDLTIPEYVAPVLSKEEIEKEAASAPASGNRTAKGQIINNNPLPEKVTVPRAPKGMVNVTLVANNVWGDFTGYQMLLDATATQYGNTIPVEGPIWGSVSNPTWCSPPATLFDVFQYKIPTNAYPSCEPTGAWIVTGSATIQIPAGTYDFCVTNPEPDWRMWIAGSYIPNGPYGRYDNFVFEDGYDYVFTAMRDPELNGDMITLTMIETGDPCPSISALSGTASGANVTLTWTAPPTGTPTGYEVRCDNVLLGTVTTTTYTHTGAALGFRSYGVKAIYPASADCIPQEVKTTVKVGDCADIIIGTNPGKAKSYLPVLRYYGNSYSQFIYYADELMEPGLISSIALEHDFTTAFQANNITIWLGNTTKSAFASGAASEFIPITEMEQVFSQAVTGPSGKYWMTFEFDEPFEYTGDNLVVAIFNPMQSYLSGDRFNNTNTTQYRSIQTYSDNTAINPAAPVSYGASYIWYNAIPNMKFFVCPGSPLEYHVYRNGDHIATTNKKSFIDTEFNPMVGHTWCVKSVCPDGTESAQACATLDYGCIEDPDCDPVVITATRIAGGNQITWTAEPGTTGRIWRNGAVIATNATSPYLDPFSPLYDACYEVDILCPNTFYTEKSNEVCLEMQPYTIPYFCGFPTQAIFNEWTVIDLNAGNTWTRTNPTTTIPPNTGVAQYTWHSSIPASDWLISPPIMVPAAGQYRLTFKYGTNSASYTERLRVTWGTANTVAAQTNVIHDFTAISGTNNRLLEAEFVADFSAAGIIHLGYYCYSAANQFNLYVTDVKLEAMFEVDLEAVSIVGPNPTVGNIYDYTITVKNKATLPANNFTLKVFTEAGELLGQRIVTTPLAPATEAQYPVTVAPFTAAQVGPLNIKGVVDIEGDEFLGNNETPLFPITVHPEGIVIIDIGDPSTTTVEKVPYNLYYRKSLSQSIYFPYEMGTNGGTINNIAYQASIDHTGTNLQNVRIRVWMGEVDNITSLSANWVDPSIFTEVYDGVRSFPQGRYSFNIPLTTPYQYNGKILVIYSQRYDGEYGSSTDGFRTTIVPGSGRSRLAYKDNTPAGEYDHTNPPPPSGNGTVAVINGYPNIGFTFNMQGMGSLSGVVKDVQGNPIEGVQVQLAGTVLYTTTNSEGAYRFLYLKAGSYAVEAGKFEYVTATANVNILPNGAATQNFTLQKRQKHTAFGAVRAADGVTFINGATVKLEITLNDVPVSYETTSGSNFGLFEFEEVWAATGYTLKVNAEGYQPYTATVNVMGNTNLGTITLLEKPIAPSNVKANYFGDFSKVTWEESTLPPVNEWIKWIAADEVTGRVGYDTYEGADMTVAIRFTPADLAAYGIVTGHPITKIALGIGTDMNAVNMMEIRIWEGGNSITNAGDLVYTQPITGWTSFAENTMLEIPLTTPFAIDASKELRIGWRLINTAGYPFGREDGGVVGGKGDLFICPTLFSGQWVSTLSQLGWNWNYSMKALVSTGGKSIEISNNAPSREAKKVVSNDNVASITDFTTVHASVAMTDELVVRVNDKGAKGVIGYKIWRLQPGDEEPAWQLLTNNPVNAMEFVDFQWANLPAETMYKYAVRTCYHGGVESPASFSNELKTVGKVAYTINVTTNSGDSPAGAQLKLANTSNTEAVYTATVPASGIVNFPVVIMGTYELEVTLPLFQDYSANINITQAGSTAVTLIEIIEAPEYPEVTVDGCKAHFTWNNEPPITAPDNFWDSFEDGTFNAWGEFIQGPGVPGEGGNAYWHVANSINPFDGIKGAFINWGYNINTWLITPELYITPTSKLTFAFNTSYYWHVDPNPNGDLWVKVSTDGGNTWTSIWREEDYGPFTSFEWCPVSLNLAAYAGQVVKIAFNMIGNDNATWDLDAVKVTPAKVVNSKSLLGYNVYLDGTLVKEKVQGTEYTFVNVPVGNRVAGVAAVYSSGLSEIVTEPFTITDQNCQWYSVTFNVKDADGEPIEEYTIEFDGEEIEGSVVKGLRPGKYPWTVSASSYLTKVGEVTITNKDEVVEVELELGINDYELGFGLYPNPASDKITVKRAATAPATIEVYNVMGAHISKYETNEVIFEMNISTLPAGTYFIRVIEGDRAGVKSFVKK